MCFACPSRVCSSCGCLTEGTLEASSRFSTEQILGPFVAGEPPAHRSPDSDPPEDRARRDRAASEGLKPHWSSCAPSQNRRCSVAYDACTTPRSAVEDSVDSTGVRPCAVDRVVVAQLLAARSGAVARAVAQTDHGRSERSVATVCTGVRAFLRAYRARGILTGGASRLADPRATFERPPRGRRSALRQDWPRSTLGTWRSSPSRSVIRACASSRRYQKFRSSLAGLTNDGIYWRADYTLHRTPRAGGDTTTIQENVDRALATATCSRRRRKTRRRRSFE